MIDFFKRWRGSASRVAAHIDSLLWERLTTRFEFLHGFDIEAAARLQSLVADFLKTKEMYGARGLVLTDEMRLAIALQACLPILNLGLAPYAGFVGIIVYPDEFRVHREETDDDGVVHEWDDELSGEAWPGGPVVLSWADAGATEAGYNVVIHEFAHKLDMLTGDADGYPPAPREMTPDQWRTRLEAAYTRFCADVDAAPVTVDDEIDFDFDPYGAEHPAEFFAVMSEEFFTAPHFLRDHYADLYALLTAFYRQDPALRLPR